jgi:CO dehydrogenase maturation factor
MTAGADSFASGLFTRFDATFCVCEPTVRGVDVYRQYVDYARVYDITVHAVGNKVEDVSDVDFLRTHLRSALQTWLTRSSYVRAAERGRYAGIESLEPANRTALDHVIAAADAAPRDWDRYTRQAREFHRRNAVAWGNGRTGEDLTDQIDPDFVLGPGALPVAGRVA